MSFGLNAGYGLSLPTYQYYNENEVSGVYETDAINLNNAGGIQLSAFMGLALFNNFRFDIDLHYQRTLGQTIESKTTNGFEVYNNVREISFSNFFVSTLISYSWKDIGKAAWHPYFSFGPSLYFSGRMKTTENFLFQNDIYDQEFETETGLSLGFQSTLGIEKALNDRLSLRVGIRLRAAFIAPKLTTLTLQEKNQEDILSPLVRDTQIEYVKEYDPDYRPTPSKPSRAPYYTNGSIGVDLSFGVIYIFPE